MERDYENDIPRIQRLLRWLVRGSRSLSLDELAECTGIDPKEPISCYDDVDIITRPRDILEMCSSLITISDDGSYVFLAHYTVKEFLTSEKTSATMNIFYVGDDDVEAELAKTCLTYLSFQDFNTGTLSSRSDLDNTLDRFKFLGYAAQSWAHHGRNAAQDRQLFDLIMSFFQTHASEKGVYYLWLQIYLYRKSARQYIPPTYVPPFYFAASFGLPAVLSALREQGHGPDGESEQNDPMAAAAFEGYRDVLEILLEDLGQGSGTERLAKYLYVAASRGHAEVLQLLVKQGVPVDAKGGKHGTALQVSSLHGQKNVVELLLEEGASTKVIDMRFGM